METAEFGQAQQVIDEYSDSDFNIDATYKGLKENQDSGWYKEILENIWRYTAKELSQNRKIVFIIILIAIGNGVLVNTMAAFCDGNVTKAGEAVTYILMTTYLISGFSIMLNCTKDALEGVIGFFRGMIPAYIMAISFTGATGSAVGFYEVLLIILDIINVVFLNFVIPAVLIYVIIIVINSVNNWSGRDFLGRTGELIYTIIQWSLKGIMGGIIGISMIQGMILPAADGVKNKAVGRIIKLIPGIGGGAEAMADILMGSGQLIKNAIGAVTVIGLIVICSLPVIKLLVYILIYKITAAIISPISGKSMIEGMDGVINGASLMVQMLVYSILTLSVAITIVCVTTNIR